MLSHHCGSLGLGVEVSKVDGPTLDGNQPTPSPVLDLVDATGPATRVLVDESVLHVLRVGDETKIHSSVVQPVAIDVIDEERRWGRGQQAVNKDALAASSTARLHSVECVLADDGADTVGRDNRSSLVIIVKQGDQRDVPFFDLDGCDAVRGVRRLFFEGVAHGCPSD